MNIYINELKQMIHQKKLIGNKLIEIMDDNEAVNKIHNQAFIYISQAMDSYSSHYENTDIILISLSLIALMQYDGNYWYYVEEIYYKYNNNKYSRQKIENTIRAILYKYRFDDNKGRQISIPIMHSIVPYNYLHNFFDFIFDIYKINFQFTLLDNLKEDFEFIYEGLTEFISTDNDDLEIEVTKKSYKLIKTTKDIIKNRYDIISLIDLSIKVIKIIDAYYWNEIEGSMMLNAYFKNGFLNWVKSYDINGTKETIYNETRKRNLEYSRWIPSFKLNTYNHILLLTPEHKIKNKHNYQEIILRVYNDAEIIAQIDKPTIVPIFGGYSIRQSEILLFNPIGKIRYIIYCGEEIIYDSKEELYHDYYIFDTNGNEIKNHTNNDNNETLFVSKVISDDQIDLIFKNQYYEIGCVIADPLKQYKLGDNTIILCSFNKPGIIGILVNNAFAEINNKKVPIYKKVQYITIESKYRLYELAILINGNRQRLKEENSHELFNGVYYNITYQLDIYVDNYFDIIIFEISSGKTISTFNFIVDSIFAFALNYQSLYLYNINVISSFKLFNSKNYNESNFILNIKENDNVLINALISNSFFRYNLILDIPLYQIDENKWNVFDNHIWYKDVGYYSKLKVKGLEFDSIYLYSSKLEKIQELLYITYDNIFYIEIGSLNIYYDKYDFMIIKFLKDDTCIKNLYYLYKCMYDKDNSYIEFNNRTGLLKIRTSYYGDGFLKIMIYESNQLLFYEEWVDNLTGINIINNFPSFRSFLIQFVEENNNFSSEKYRVEHEEWVKFYRYNDLVDKMLFIDQVEFYSYNRKTNLLSSHTINFYNTYLFFDKQIGEKKFIGKVLINKNGEYIPLKHINIVDIELVSIIENDGVWCAITNENDGLYLDYSNKTIFDVEYSKTANAIYQYHINFRRKGRKK